MGLRLLPTTASRSHRIPAPAGEMAVTEYDGEGPSVLLLHGIGGQSATWWPLIDALAAQVRPITLDLRGHGDSAQPRTGYDLSDYADDVAAVVDALGLDRPCLLGHSLGALVTLEWAIAHPDRAAALVLEDPPLRGAPGGKEVFDGWIALNAMTMTEAADYFRTDQPGLPDATYRLWAEGVTGTSPAVYREPRARLDLSPTDADPLARIDVIRSPTLVIHGDLDLGGMFHLADADRLAALLPSVHVHRLRGAGHSLHRDRPDDFLRLAVPFLLQG